MEINSIEWHEECLKNTKISLLEKKKRFVELQEDIERCSNKIDFYDDQVRSARIIGKSKFNRDKFKVKRKPRKTTDSEKES